MTIKLNDNQTFIPLLSGHCVSVETGYILHFQKQGLARLSKPGLASRLHHCQARLGFYQFLDHPRLAQMHRFGQKKDIYLKLAQFLDILDVARQTSDMAMLTIITINAIIIVTLIFIFSLQSKSYQISRRRQASYFRRKERRLE